MAPAEGILPLNNGTVDKERPLLLEQDLTVWPGQLRLL
ncbi:hypothetical protein PHA8399_01609 [Leisingera aquaemixtae]|uniref:Uncharacterized protein n=1 Tax=Leisingera aquaemixtae TaxID=1396826 RepID=A0A0P1HN82_9RHOB|nr:hypothetical protein PHA8399_01609 [Leisingera aquaemixtae]